MVKKIVAAPGFEATLQVGNRIFELTSYEFLDLSIFSKKELDASNLSTLMNEGWVIEYTGQELPRAPQRVIPEIPHIEASSAHNKGNQAKVVQTQKGKRIVTEVELPKSSDSSTDENVKLTTKDLKKSISVNGEIVEKFKAPKKDKKSDKNERDD